LRSAVTTNENFQKGKFANEFTPINQGSENMFPVAWPSCKSSRRQQVFFYLKKML
jgi:hypothetical protein